MWKVHQRSREAWTWTTHIYFDKQSVTKNSKNVFILLTTKIFFRQIFRDNQMIWRSWRHVALCAVPPELFKNLDDNHVTRFIQRRCIILVMVKTIYFDVVKSYYHEWNGHNNSRIFRYDVPDDLFSSKNECRKTTIMCLK